MDCREAREGLWPPERPRLVGDEVAAARSHVDRCPDCKEFFAQDRGLLDTYYRFQQLRAPREVRERVFEALAQARATASPPSAARWTAWARRPYVAAVAVTIAVGTAVGLAMALGGPDAAATAPADESAYIDDYLRRAVSRDYLETGDPAAITRFLERELGMDLRPLSVEGLRPRRVEICLLDGLRGAMIEYVVEGRVVSHYLLPRAGLAERPPALRERSGPRALPVVTWAAPSVEQALVGDLSGERLLGLAREAVLP